jgi:protein-disulfide isomerase
MSRSLIVSLTAAILFVMTGSGQNKKTALDKPTLEAYLRHLWVVDSKMGISIGDPKPSAILPGFLDITVRISMGAQGQDVPIIVSKDGSHILQGNVYDVATNPFKKELDKLKTQGEPDIGTPGAPVVLVEFSDFECPYCKEEAQLLRKNLLTDFPTQVRLYFKTFPIDSLHPWARGAAIAGRCVFNQMPADFWEYHDWVFNHQSELTPETLKDRVLGWAKDRPNIDALKLSQCIDNKSSEADVNRNIAEGQAIGVDRTPTLFLNGRKIDQSLDWPSLKGMIQHEVDYQKIAKDAGDDCGCEVKLPVPSLRPAAPAIQPGKSATKKQ